MSKVIANFLRSAIHHKILPNLTKHYVLQTAGGSAIGLGNNLTFYKKEVENLFDIQLAGYWKEHYLLDKASTPKVKALGKRTIHILTINTIAPILFLYGKEKDLPAFCELALQLLENIPPESNHLIAKWDKLGFPAENAYQSQALLQLFKKYCQPKNCLNCSIGGAILKN